MLKPSSIWTLQIRPFWKQIFLLWLAVVLPGVLISATAVLIAHFVGNVSQASGVGKVDAGSVFQSAMFAPLVETALLALAVEALRLSSLSRFAIAVIIGCIGGLLHGIAAPLWSFSTAWGFFVFASAYQAWRTSSLPLAFLSAFLPHALNNTTSLMLLYFIG